jgi:predicted Rossmann fold flavoprotein
MQPEKFNVIVVGGGAAGFFAAIQAAERNSTIDILILEKSNKVLSKVRISGGGRCNVTHHCFNPFQLANHYPRGEKSLKELFKLFQASDMEEWLRSRGVELKTESDGRMFPITDSSQTIIDCFLRQSERYGIKVRLNSEVTRIDRNPTTGGVKVTLSDSREIYADSVIVATGGSPKTAAYQWLSQIGHNIIKPIPSLFTFNDHNKHFADLMGISVPSAEVKISGSKFMKRGPVLITHWGLSGPAVIKLSAWAAAYLFEKQYDFQVLVNWTPYTKENDVRNMLADAREKKQKQKVITNPLLGLPARLWERLCILSEIDPQKLWGGLSNKNLNKMLENLYRCQFMIRGKTTYKEEFVTCGGVDLADIDPKTMESRKMKNLYFAGEVLNIDGETGGFNFQAAWTTAYIAAKSLTAATSA